MAASHKTAPKGATITLTVAPDKDFVMDGLAVVDGAGAAIKLTDMGNGKYTFIMPASKVTVEGSFKEEFPDFPNPFSDIAPSDFCCDAVMWAVAKDITNGIGNYNSLPTSPAPVRRSSPSCGVRPVLPLPRARATSPMFPLTLTTPRQSPGPLKTASPAAPATASSAPMPPARALRLSPSCIAPPAALP